MLWVPEVLELGGEVSRRSKTGVESTFTSSPLTKNLNFFLPG